MINVRQVFGGTPPAVIDINGVCYEYLNLAGTQNTNDVTNYDSFASCTDCQAIPTPTPTPSPVPAPTPAPSSACIAIQVGYSTGQYYGCCTPPDNYGTKYFNANSVASATRMYSGLGCTELDRGTVFVSEFGSTYYEFYNLSLIHISEPTRPY